MRLLPLLLHRLFSRVESLPYFTRTRNRALRYVCLIALFAACTARDMPGVENDSHLKIDTVLQAVSVPPQFSDVQVTAGLNTPTAMEVAPDGRVFVCEKGGALRVVKNGSLLAAPFLSLAVDGAGERGLLGVAFDPNFASEPWVYIYYTVPGANHNRVSRFRASSGNGDVSDGVENVLFELSQLSDAVIHNGGAIHFGADGKLYIAAGENATPTNAQDMGVTLGKILRINKDGSIPSDNPFFASAAGNARAIWALGFRNPFTFAVQPGTGRIFINDVGKDSWEEVDELFKGDNYGWPVTEGVAQNPNYQDPFFTYANGPGVNQADCAIIGATFYNPASQQFPASFVGSYFFGDFCSGYIKQLDLTTKSVTEFANGITQLIDLKVAKDGSLYYVTLGGILSRISYTGSFAPVIGTQPTSRTVSVGQSTTFSVAANGSAPLAYQWQRNGANIAGANAASYTRSNIQLSDNGAQFRVVVSNASGSATSNAATLTVTSNTPPVATISTPAVGATYVAGTTIAFSGSASDAEDGALSAAALTWKVDFQHESHSHPVLAATSGITSGSFPASDRIETSSNVWYRVTLTATDSGGLSTTVTRDIQPVKAVVTLTTNPAGLSVKLDGTPVTTPYTFTGVAGVIRALDVVSPQTLSGQTYVHASWSDGKPAQHEIVTPAVNTTYTDTLRATSAFVSADVGSVGKAGSFTQNGGSYDVAGSGDDIWNSADAFQFVYQPLNGDGEISARVASLGNTDPWAKAGVMVRESLAAGSRHALMAVTSGNGLAFQRRDQTSAASAHTGVSGSAPQWVRLVRSGNSLRGYRSSDGVSWTLVGETTQTLPTQVLVGMAVTAHNNTLIEHATFDSVNIINSSTPAFTASDVGSVGVAGSTQVSGGSYTVKGSGADIWGTADGCQFYHRSISGDGEIKVRVASLVNTDQWAKAGIMIRETLAAGSRHVYTGTTPSNGVEFSRREQPDASTIVVAASGAAPAWFRLVRQGNTFTSFSSSDGNVWTQIGSATVTMASDVQAGLVVTSHNNSVLTTGVFDSLTVND